MKKTYQLKLRKVLSVMIIMFSFSSISFAQTGTNIDFSLGNYTNWKGYQGVANGTASLVSSWTFFSDPSTVYWQGNPCFVINTPTSAAFDFTVPTLRRVPTMWGYTHSSQINNNQPNKNCSKLSYDLDITPLNCLLTFNYAMVLQSPGHSGYENPTFRIEVRTLTGSTEGALVDPCATFEQIGTTPAPAGWNTFSGGIWQNWRQVSMNLSAYEGSRVRINIILTDCSPSAHWAYGYVTAKVGPAELTVNACGNGDTIAIIEAPPGFKKYEWISSATAFTDASTQYAIGPIISQSTATATVPANNKLVIRQNDPYSTHQYFAVKLTSPNSGSTPACEAFIKATVQSMKPIPDFDTVLDCALKVDFVDQTVLGAGYNSIADTLEYTWDFGDGNTAYYNSFTANNSNRNPSHTYPVPGPYAVKLTVKDQGCENIITKDILLNYLLMAPTNLLMQNVNNYLQLSWQGDSPRYGVYLNDSLVALLDTNVYIDTNAISGTNYCFKVKAIRDACESDFSNQLCGLFVGLEKEISINKNIRIYPNPTSRKVILDINGEVDKYDSYQVIESSARVIINGEIKSSKTIIDLTNYTKGMYYLCLYKDGALKGSYKLIKK
ncbi:MAG: hypothetical protein H6Q15_1906 [Bacteroidetes bacterium]|nr:hypothetical protein [Bacteroidota bacterium]